MEANNKGKCDICLRPATYNFEGLRYCDEHRPIYEPAKEPRQYKPPSPLTTTASGVEDDVRFLMDFARFISKEPRLTSHAIRLRQIASNIQASLDDHAEKLYKLRSQRQETAPALNGRVRRQLQEQWTAVIVNDAISQLNQICHAAMLDYPEYHFHQKGPDHAPEFECRVNIETPGGKQEFWACAKTKKEAKHAAAQKAVTMLRRATFG